MSFLANKRALIVGVASTRSIAYGIAQTMHREGAALAFTYQNDRLKDRVIEMAAEFNSEIVMPCDVSQDSEIHNLFEDLKKYWDGIDIIVHSVAFAPSDQLGDDYVNCVNRDAFRIAHDISSYSFVALAKAARPMMQNRQGALLALSYLGAERVIQNYNVMGVAKASLEANVRYMASCLGPEGIRVNAISAGPVRTLAAAGIKDFKKLLAFNAQVAPLRHNVTLEEIGNTAAFLCSNMASGITGEIVHVDAGFHCVTLAETENKA